MSATPLAIDQNREDLSGKLATVAPFKGLPDAVLKAVSEAAETRQYLAGEVLIAPGQFDGAEFYLVRSGRLKASHANGESGSMVIEEIGRDAFFGLAEAVSGEGNATAETLTLAAEEDVEIIAFDAAPFCTTVAQRPSLTRNLMQYFAAVLARVSAPQAEESSAERRVFAALIEYVERDAVSGDWRVPKMPKHRELAERAGADEAAAASAVAQLIQQGVARREYPGLVIADMAGLTRLAS